MKIKYVFKVKLNESEAFALKKILGGVTDDKKKEIGLNDDGIELMRTLWESLPDEEE